MSGSKLPKKPEIGQRASFKPLKQRDLTISGIVLRYIVDTPERWKVEIQVDELSGPYASSYMDFLDQAIMFEHTMLVSIEGDTNINP